MRFRDAKCGEWVKVKASGFIVQKLRQLNGSNCYCLNRGDYGYVKPYDEVEPSVPPVHPQIRHRIEPHLQTFHLFGDGTWSKGQ